MEAVHDERPPFFLILAKIVPRYITLTRQYHRETTTFSQFALDVQCSVMSHNKITGDGKPQSASLNLRSGNPEIMIENTLMIARIYSFTKIPDIHFDAVFSFLPGTNNYPTIFR